MPITESPRKAEPAVSAFATWARGIPLFSIAVAFAVSGHVVFALLLNSLKFSGADFAALDSDRLLIPSAQISLFALQTGLIVAALIRTGLEMKRTIVAVAALVFAASMLMLTFVSAQCDLFGSCL